MEIMGQSEWIPRIGMEFETTEEVWDYWRKYAGRTGFNARKGYNNRSVLDRKTTSRAFVCSNEGFRRKDKRDDQVKYPRDETRTGCQIRLVVKLIRKSNKYEIIDFINEHNHMLQLPQASYLMPCQRKVTDVAAFNIDLTDNFGIQPKAAREFMSLQAGGVECIGHTLTDHNNYLRDKRERTLIHDAAMGIAIANMMPDVSHGLCTWHISENATKHLISHNDDEMDCVAEFRTCIFGYEDEGEFQNAFSTIQRKVGGTWLPFVYKERKKWAYCYMKDVFSLGIRSTQLSESLNKDLKNYLKSDLDIVRFFKHFERVVADKREKEVVSEYECRKKVSRIKVNVPILLQMSKRYTPKNFELFQEEYELSMAAQIQGPIANEYIVRIYNMGDIDPSSKGYRVFWNPIDQIISCSCRKFERWGFLCSHALKVLDTMNIKLLSENYILKRWTREARDEVVCDRNGIGVVDTRLDATRRNRDLCRKFTRIAAKTSESEEISAILDDVLDKFEKQLDERMLNFTKTTISHDKTSLTSNLLDKLSQNPPRLKKKDGKRGSKRNKSWVERLSKINKKRTSVKKSKPQHAFETSIINEGCPSNMWSLPIYNLQDQTFRQE